MPTFSFPLDHEATFAVRVTPGARALRLELVRFPGERRFALERALRRCLRVRANGSSLAFSAETDRLELPAGTPAVEIVLGEDPAVLLLALAVGTEPVPARTPHLLSPFETRFLADNGTPHPVPLPGSGPAGLVTDLHTHLAGCVGADDLLELGLAAGVAFPAALLERAGIRTGRDADVPLDSLSPPLRRLLASRFSLPLDRQVPFAGMETVYRLRAPITKSRAAFVPLLRRIAADYARMGVRYAELSFFDILDGERLAAAHREVPRLERETGVTLRFLVALNRHDDLEWDLDLLDRIDQLAASRVIAGVDFMGQETNSTLDFAPQLRAVAEWAARRRPGFVVRVHAGENPAHPGNVRDAVEAVHGWDVRLRIGHGLYGADARTLELLCEARAVVEFNLNSNLALNNVQGADEIPLATYLAAGVPCVLGTDGYGIYRTTLDLEAQAARLAGVGDAGLAAVRATEAAWIAERRKHEEAQTVSLGSFVVPAPPPPRHYGPAVVARKRERAERRDLALRARLDALGVPLLAHDEIRTLLQGKRILAVAGAWKASWEGISPGQQEHVRRELAALAAGLEAATTVVIAGGTSWGVEGILAREARRRGIPVLGALVQATPPGALAPDVVTHAALVAESLYGKVAGLYPLLFEHGGACLFVGGGHIVSDEIQAAANLRLPFFLMDGPEGASTLHARLHPERAVRSAAKILERLAAFAPWPSTRDPYWHLGANPIADVVVLREEPSSSRRRLLLVRRHDDAAAEPGAWALPGGFQLTDAPRGTPWMPGHETAVEAAVRELREETGLDVSGLEASFIHVGDFEGDGRDPRDTAAAWSRSRAFLLRLPAGRAASPVAGGDDAADARWFGLDELPARLAFDHARIVARALERLRGPG